MASAAVPRPTMAAPGPSKLKPILRKSILKRTSCYDDFGIDSSSKPAPVKKQKQLQLQCTQETKPESKPDRHSKPKERGQTTIDGDKNESAVAVEAAQKPAREESNKQREAFVILIHTFNPFSISEVAVGQAFFSLGKANAGVTDLFKRVKPEYADLVVDIGTAIEFDDPEDGNYPDVRRRMTPSGRVAYMWHTEEGRGELSVHRIAIE